MHVGQPSEGDGAEIFFAPAGCFIGVSEVGTGIHMAWEASLSPLTALQLCASSVGCETIDLDASSGEIVDLLVDLLRR